jgi:hypothetical protein
MSFKTTMQMGLGEAIKRLNLLHSKKGRGIATVNEKSEHDLILDALNQTQLDLGFDCNGDNIPDSIEIFAKSAQTSCCRIIDTGSERIKPQKKSKSKKVRRRG